MNKEEMSAKSAKLNEKKLATLETLSAQEEYVEKYGTKE